MITFTDDAWQNLLQKIEEIANMKMVELRVYSNAEKEWSRGKCIAEEIDDQFRRGNRG